MLKSLVRALWHALPLQWRVVLRWGWRRGDAIEYPTPRDIRGMLATLTAPLRPGVHRKLWFLPSHTWFSAGFQRPQQMAIALGETGCEVVYWEPWNIPEAIRTGESDRERRFAGLRRIAPGVWLVRCPEETYVHLLAACVPDWIVFYWPDQARHIPPGSKSRVVYEMIDDHSLEKPDDNWKRTHQHWLRNADIVVGSADDLVGQLRAVRKDALLLPNGVRSEDWEDALRHQLPRDLVEARAKRIVVGYYGAIAGWFDFDMWLAAAKARPDWAFVWIGYPYGSAVEETIREAVKLDNVYYLGKKPYRSLPAYLRYFDVATIPFVLNPITHACSPVKLFEYMAASKPVVATPMREILKYRSVFFASDPREFVSRIEEAHAKSTDPGYLELLRGEAHANTWRARASVLGATMDAIECGHARPVATADNSSRIT